MGSATKHEVFCPVCGESVKRAVWERGEKWSADGWRIDTWTYSCGHVREVTEVKR